MMKLHKVPAVSTLTIFSFLLFFLFAPSSSSALTPSGYLANAVNFAVLANTTVTNTGTTTVTGTAGSDVGVSPGSSITPGPMTSGTLHPNDAAAISAHTSLVAAYTTLSTMATTKSDPGAALGGQTLTPGVYKHGDFGITGTLTLDGGGDPGAIFVFQTDTTLITAGASRVVLTNDAQACNVYWAVGSSATLGTTSVLVGHVVAKTAITATTGASITGQLLARDAAVTLDSNTITNNICAAEDTDDATASPGATDTDDATATATPSAVPCTSTIRTLTFTSDGLGATTGKLTWVTSGPGLVQFVGDPALYPAPFNYGTLTSSWNGTLVNMVPTTVYQVAVRFRADCGLVSEASTVASNAAAVATPTPVITPTPTPVVTPTPTPTPTPVVTPTPTPTPVITATPTLPPTQAGGKLPKTGSPWYNVLAGGVLLALIGVTGWVVRRA